MFLFQIIFTYDFFYTRGATRAAVRLWRFLIRRAMHGGFVSGAFGQTCRSERSVSGQVEVLLRGIRSVGHRRCECIGRSVRADRCPNRAGWHRLCLRHVQKSMTLWVSVAFALSFLRGMRLYCGGGGRSGIVETAASERLCGGGAAAARARGEGDYRFRALTGLRLSTRLPGVRAVEACARMANLCAMATVNVPRNACDANGI